MDVVNSRVIQPLRPYLLPITRGLPKPIDDFASSLLGKKCHRSLVYNLDLSARNLECVKLAVSKALGVAIIAASSIVKVPQLIKLLQSRSAVGVSFLSYLLETASFTITLAYSLRHGYPFSTYGETALIAIQDIAIALCILLFSGQSSLAAVFIAGIAAAGYALFSDAGIVDMKMLGYLQAGAGVLGNVAKLPQIYTIWAQGTTGQLSAFAVFNYLAGSLARVFTTLQEVDDPLILYGYIAGFALNFIIAGQMVYYWNAPTKSKARSSRPKKVPEEGQWLASGSGSAMTSGASPKGKGPSTRRRG